MARLKNKTTGKEYVIADKDLPLLKSRPDIAKAFTIIETTVPEEVQELLNQKFEELKIESLKPKRKRKGTQ